MQTKQTTYTNIAKLMLCAMLFFVLPQHVSAQLKNAFDARLLEDSLIANTNKDFLYNTVTITNNSTEKLNIVATITVPGKWQMISDNIVNISLDPNASQIVTMRLRPGNGNTSMWQQVKIEYRIQNTGEIRNEFFKVRVKEYSKFKTMLPNPNMVLGNYQRNINIPIYIKNMGNVDTTYDVKINNDYFHIDSKVKVSLKASSDTTYLVPLTITEHEYAQLKKEEVRIQLGLANDNYNLTQTISKIASFAKDHKSPYEDMPIQFELGTNYSGNAATTQYFGGVYGSLDLSKTDRLSFAYRSNTYSSTSTTDNSMIKLDYMGVHVSSSLGNISEASELPVSGYGVKFGYNWNSTDKLSLYSILKSTSGDKYTLGGLYTRELNKSIKLNENLSSEMDKTNNQNIAIGRQSLDYNFDDSTKLSVITGASFQQNNNALVDNSNRILLGSSLGYDFKYIRKEFNLVSTIINNSNNFAGINRGQRTQSHDIRIVANNFFYGFFFQNTYNKQNTFFDSLFLKDVFSVSSTAYGFRSGWVKNDNNLMLTLGNQKQSQAGESNNFQAVYKYGNLSFTTKFLHRVFFQINSSLSLGSVEAKGLNNIFASSTAATLKYRSAGISMQYASGPAYYNDFTSYIKDGKLVERTMISPYWDFKLFKKCLTGRMQYNFAESSNSTAQVSTLLVNMGYVNVHSGYEFHLTGNIPTGQSAQSTLPNVSASMRFRITAPCVAIKKYGTIRIHLFKDANNDGVRQKDEEPIVGQMIAINGNIFISDEDGDIVYKNLSNGKYKVDMGYTSKIKGWAPSVLAIQEIEVDGDNIVQEVAFRKSRVLDGKLVINIDSNSNMRFHPGNIKVIVTTSGSQVYSTLTEDDGSFSFNLPEGVYTVSLSPTSFDEFFRPVDMSKTVDLSVNESKKVYFEIRQKRRQMNIKKK